MTDEDAKFEADIHAASAYEKTCEHECGNTTIRRPGCGHGMSKAWQTWLTDHGLGPFAQVAVNGGCIVRNERDRTVSALVFDLHPAPGRQGKPNPPWTTTMYTDCDENGDVNGPRYAMKHVQLDRVPAPFPTEGDCPQRPTCPCPVEHCVCDRCSRLEAQVDV